jgi:hypothetical protein
MIFAYREAEKGLRWSQDLNSKSKELVQIESLQVVRLGVKKQTRELSKQRTVKAQSYGGEGPKRFGVGSVKIAEWSHAELILEVQLNIISPSDTMGSSLPGDSPGQRPALMIRSV